VHVRLCSTNARDRGNHVPIIPAPLPPPLAGEGRVGHETSLVADKRADAEDGQAAQQGQGSKRKAQ
jgi:hypothetical protein